MKIRYKLASCSSQHPSNPAINLISGTGDWESARFCSYPQQITLEFYEPVIINTIKITSHSHKVSQRTNILYHLPTEENPHQFTKLGFMKFSSPNDEDIKKEQKDASNTKTLRQIKMVQNLNLNALYLRLILTQNYVQKSNFFNQVALSSIQILGTGSQSIFPRVQLKNDSFILISNIGKQKVNVLTQFKQKFIEKQQYHEAQQTKQIINKIHSILSQIKLLNQQKIKCVQQEQYQEAKQIKQEITKLKQKIQYMSDHFYDPQKKIINKFQIRSARKKIPSINLGLENNFDNQFMKNQDIQKEENNQKSFKNQHDPQSKVIIEQKDLIFNKSIEYDQQVVPALLNKLNKSDVKSDTEIVSESRIQQNLPDQPEELTPSNQANSSILVQFYEKMTIRKLYSKYWQFKFQAVQEILTDSKKQSNSLISKNKLRAFIFVYNLILSRQNHKQLILSTLDLMNQISGFKISQKDFKAQLNREFQKSIIFTLEKTQQSQNPKIKTQAEKTLQSMVQSQIYGCSIIYKTIFKAYDQKMSSKLKKVYLDSLELAVSNSKNIKNEIPVSVINFVIKRLEDPNNEVRKSSISLLKALKNQGYQDHIKVSLLENNKYKQSVFKELNFQ